MIEFEGKFSEECKRYLLKKLAIGGFFVSLITSVIFGIIIIAIAAVLDIWIITWFIAVLGLFVVAVTASPYIERKKTLENTIPRKINIDKNKFIEVEWEKRSMIKSVSDVKKIIDMGGWYYIIFYFPKASDFACQKDLIVKGTIEDFEKLFEGKIVVNEKHNEV